MSNQPLPVNPNLVKILNNVSAQNPNIPEFGNNGKFTDIEEVIINASKSLKSKNSDLMGPNLSTELPNIGQNVSLNNYNETYTTGEVKARLAKFADPLTINYKLILDFDRKSGLLASEDNVDSALAFLKRIGDKERYEMLNHWIMLFQTIVKDYDFLFMDVEGLQEVQFNHPTKFFLDNNKLKFTVRETLDMMFQALITTYRDICYDNIRGVTVLPSNLQKFDCYVVVYSAGYYNILFHDFNNESSDDLDLKVLPTKRKLSDEYFNLDTITDFNHMLYQFVSCKFDFESGQDFLSSISNDMSSDIVKNNITLTYKFANSSGTFNNITGNDNFFNVLALAAAENKLRNEVALTQSNTIKPTGEGIENESNSPLSGNSYNPFNPNSKSKFWNNNKVKKILSNTKIDEQLQGAYKQFSNKDTYKNIYKNLKETTINKLNDKLMNQIPTKLLGPHTVLGNLFEGLNVDNVTNILQNTIDKGINVFGDKIDTGITKVNNLLFNNFSDDLVEIYNNVFQQNNVNQIQVIEQTPKPPYPQKEEKYEGIDNYVRPDNPNISNDDSKFISDKINPTLENSKQKFTKGTEGLTFFGSKSETFNKGNNNIYVRKTF